MEDIVGVIFGLVGIFLVIWIFILLPAGMAERRGRSQFGWVVLSLLFSPILACLLLALLGNNPNQTRRVGIAQIE